MKRKILLTSLTLSMYSLGSTQSIHKPVLLSAIRQPDDGIRSFTPTHAFFSSPDDKHTLLINEDQIFVLSTKGMTHKKTFTSHNDDIITLNYSPDGKYVISFDRSGLVVMWQLSNMKIIKQVQTRLDKSFLNSANSSPISVRIDWIDKGVFKISDCFDDCAKPNILKMGFNGKKLSHIKRKYEEAEATYSLDKRLKLQYNSKNNYNYISNAKTNKILKRLESSELSVQFSRFGDFLAIYSELGNKPIEIYSNDRMLKTGKPIKKFTPPKNNYHEVEFLSNNLIAIYYSIRETDKGGKVLLYNYKKDKAIGEFAYNNNNLFILEKIPKSNTYLYCLHRGGSIDHICGLLGSKLNKLKDLAFYPSSYRTIAQSPSGKLVAFAMKNGSVGIWNVHTNKLVKSIYRPTDIVAQIIFFGEDKLGISYSIFHDGYYGLDIYSIKTKKLLASYPEHGGYVKKFPIKINGKYYISTTRENLFTLSTSEKKIISKKKVNFNGNVIHQSKGGFTADNSMRDDIYKDHLSISFDRKKAHNLNSFFAQLLVDAFLGDSGHTAVLTKSRYLVILDKNLNVVQKIGNAFNGKSVVDLSSDGKLVAVGGDNRTVKIWDVKSGKQIHVFKNFSAPIRYIKFTEDTKKLVVDSGISDLGNAISVFGFKNPKQSFSSFASQVLK